MVLLVCFLSLLVVEVGVVDVLVLVLEPCTFSCNIASLKDGDMDAKRCCCCCCVCWACSVVLVAIAPLLLQWDLLVMLFIHLLLLVVALVLALVLAFELELPLMEIFKTDLDLYWRVAVEVASRNIFVCVLFVSYFMLMLMLLLQQLYKSGMELSLSAYEISSFDGTEELDVNRMLCWHFRNACNACCIISCPLLAGYLLGCLVGWR
mmetsp:Transcript_5276/g.6453  ORF Transcript_5276/g.6453 Transcript_5276/m.6453 type:complete len:207 (+) Transcript_5276:1004-1624(+)